MFLEPISKLYGTCLPGRHVSHLRVLKELGLEIAKLLTVLYNLWFGVNSILEDWKVAYDIPIFRKDFRENDRPVNLNMWLITV